MNKNILKAIEIFNKGGIVIFPTDTAFGIGCRIDKEESIKKLFEIRERPESQPTPILVSNLEMAQKYLESISADVEKLMKKFWPGALTIILPCKTSKVPSLVRGGGKTLGVRIPNNKKIFSIIEALKVPILGPSANIHGESTPYSLEDLDKRLIAQVDYVMSGETLVKEPSTVIDCSRLPWKILRKGAVSL